MIGKSKIKYIQSLGQKKQRDSEALFIAEGPKIINELIASAPGSIVELYALKTWLDKNKNIQWPVHEISEAELGQISQLKTPNEIVAVVSKFPEVGALITRNRITLLLDTIQDPGNMGTIIRIADWFGVSHLVCSHECADIYNPKVVQASMGSIARVKTIYTDVISWLKQVNEPVYAMMLDGKNVREMKPVNEAVIVIGNESRGVGEELLPFITDKITIPGKGGAESLNAAVATGIVLSHLSR